MKYEFTLKFGVSAADFDMDELVARLGAAGCEDALVGIGQPGRIALNFTRDAESAQAAVDSALADVRRAIPDAKCLAITTDSFRLPNIPTSGADRQYLNFWENGTLNACSLAEFLHLKPSDIVNIADVASLCELVAQQFEGDVRKTDLWFKTRNPLLGNIAPRNMIRQGRCDRVRRFVLDAIVDNTTAPLRSPPEHVQATSTP